MRLRLKVISSVVICHLFLFTASNADAALVVKNPKLRTADSAKLNRTPMPYVLYTPSSTGTAPDAESTELKRALIKLRAKGVDKALLERIPNDTEGLLSARELRISGNKLISTTDLLKRLPMVYDETAKTRDKREPNESDEVYDFRVLYELILHPRQNYEVSPRTIKGLTKYILSVYQDRGYAAIYVYVPKKAIEQEAGGQPRLKDGILRVEVLEARVEKITIERFDILDPNHQLLDPSEKPSDPNQKRGYLRSTVLESWSPVKVGDTPRGKDLDAFVNLLNLNPDRFIRHYISRGDDPNSLNLGYDIYEGNPWHYYVQADNAGTKDRQWAPRLGVVNTNLTGFDDRFSVMYQAPWEKDIEDEYSVFANYDFPLFTPRLRLNLYGGYSQFDVTPEGGGGINFLGNGSFYGGVLSYNVLQIGDWFVDVTGSLSQERSKVTPSLGLDSDVDIELWGAGVNLHRSSNTSNSSISLTRFKSMGGSTKTEFTAARLNADPDFTIWNFAALHSQYLDPNDKVHQLSGSFRLINPSERLVPVKMTTFGGLYSVRGYEEDEIVADGGMLLSAQYEFDLVKHSGSVRNSRANKKSSGKQGDANSLRKLALVGFFDYGRAKVKSPVAGEKRITELSSVGAGIVMEMEKGLGASLYVGWPLRSTADTNKGNPRLNLSVIKRF